MMRGTGGALAVTLAALLICCHADPHQEQDGSASEHSGDSGHKSRSPEGGSLVRQVRESRHSGLLPYLGSRRYENSPYNKQMWTLVAPEYGYYGEGFPKRNFDEIDRSGLDNFVRKRNFDEIDQTSMPFPYAKRFYHVYGSNYLDTPVSMYDRNRRQDMDEIDFTKMPFGGSDTGYRRAMEYPLLARLR